jgi:ADP-ribose pyrophosphatase
MENTVSSRIIYEGKHFTFKTDTVKLENGKKTVRDYVEHPGAVAIIAVDDDEILLVNQFRYATGMQLLEIPAGTLEHGEDPQSCAIRELKEETGYVASDWKKLLSCFTAPGYSSEVIHIFVAQGLTYLGARPEEDEFIRVERVNFNDVLDLIEKNIIKDSKTISGILSYLTRSKI